LIPVPLVRTLAADRMRELRGLRKRRATYDRAHGQLQARSVVNVENAARTAIARRAPRQNSLDSAWCLAQDAVGLQRPIEVSVIQQSRSAIRPRNGTPWYANRLT
jgi:hypothetical protein